MKLEIILALVLVTTLCSSAHTLIKRSTDLDDVEDANDEGETGAAAPAEELTEQGIEIGLPVSYPKQTHEGEKRMDLPLFTRPEVCTGWIGDFFDEYLVMNEDRDAVFSDLQRFFIFMDDDGDGKISEPEFKPKWMEATGFSELDTASLFYTFFSMVRDPEDEDYISSGNVEGIWEELFMSDIEGGELSKEDFGLTWQNIILPALPQRGCSGLKVQAEDGETPDAAKENAQIRPDVYGYFKRKRK